jgi:sortase A
MFLTLLFKFSSPVSAEVYQLIIPKLEVKIPVGTENYLEDLTHGAAQWAWTPEPGVVGNTVIGGHRTVNPGYFIDLDTLQTGDELVVVWQDELLHYQVIQTLVLTRPHPAGIIDRRELVADQLTLVTCHPKYQDSQRLVIRAEMVD